VTDRRAPAVEGERLQKILAQAGIGSRRACEELIAEGRVSVNGETAELGRRVRTEHDAVAVDGTVIGIREGLAYYLLNKPAGVVSTASDPERRPTVVDLVPSQPRVYPVGRLDVESEGLLLLTNDGDLAHRLTHPSFGAEKEYLVTVRGELRPGELRILREGVELDDGITAPAKVSQISPGVLRMTIHEGRNRQVRRMTDAVGHPVTRLVRTRIGPVRIGALGPGSYRELEVGEVRALEREASGPSRRLVRRASRRTTSPDSPGV
jgi:23S rRNA pseudouridine2605 synthase